MKKECACQSKGRFTTMPVPRPTRMSASGSKAWCQRNPERCDPDPLDGWKPPAPSHPRHPFDETENLPGPLPPLQGQGVRRKRTVSTWNRLVQSTYHKLKKKHPRATFKQAVQKASSKYRRKGAGVIR